MSWQILVGISVLLFSLNGSFHRTIMRDLKSDPYTQTILFYGLGGIFVLILSLFNGGVNLQIRTEQIPYIILLTIFATAAPVLVFKSLKLIQASESSILLSSQRLWIVIGAFLFLREDFSFSKLLGVIIVIIGITIAQWKKRKFVINQGVIYALLAALAYAVTEIIAFYLLRDFDTISFTVLLSFLPVIILLIIKPGSIKKLTFYFKPEYARSIIVVSINDAIATLFLFFAYQVGRNAAQIAPIMARSDQMRRTHL